MRTSSRPRALPLLPTRIYWLRVLYSLSAALALLLAPPRSAAASTVTLPVMQGVDVDHVASGTTYFVDSPLKSGHGRLLTSGSSTTVTAETAADKSFLGVAIGDQLVLQDGSIRYVTARASSTSITVNSPITITPSQSFQYRTLLSGVASTSGWFSTANLGVKTFTFKLDQVNATGGVAFTLECDSGGVVGTVGGTYTYTTTATNPAATIYDVCDRMRVGANTVGADDGVDTGADAERASASMTASIGAVESVALPSDPAACAANKFVSDIDQNGALTCAAVTVSNQSTGYATPPTAASGSVFQVVGADASIARVEADSFGAISAFTARRANGTIASPSAILSGDQIGAFNWHGYYTSGGPGYSGVQASVQGFATQNWTSTAFGTKIVFSTTPNDSTTLTTAATIDQDQVATFVKRVSAPSFVATRQSVSVSSHAVTCDWSLGAWCSVTLQGGGADTITLSNPSTGGTYTITLIQPTGSDGTVTWPGAVHWPSGVSPTLTTTDTNVDLVTCKYNGSVYFCGSVFNYAP